MEIFPFIVLRVPFQYSELMFCSSVRNCIAYANEANIVNKDSPVIAALDFDNFVRCKGTELLGSATWNEEF